ncbi:MAG TPA: hypothetical protein VLJ80_07335 [Solirubrobacteraceae bacterium]|nr:hypothetical protein [Solirubrobacteraceae bacterium]
MPRQHNHAHRRKQSRRRRALAAVYPLGVLVAVTASLILGPYAGGSVVALALGLFAALLTAITLVILLTLDVDSRWPSLPDVVAESYLVAWFLLAMASVTLAAFVDDAKPKWLTTLAITLALASGVLGSISLFQLLRISTGEGRQQYLGHLLAVRLNRLWGIASDGTEIDEMMALKPFLVRFQSAIDVADISALRERVSEISIAGETTRQTNLTALLALDLKLIRDLGRAILLGRLDSPDVGTGLLPQLGKVIAQHAVALNGQSKVGPEAQRTAAAYLGEASRSFAWLESAAYREAVERGEAPPELCAAAAGAVVARDHILDAVDPETAEPASALPEGLTDPAAVLIWWWCYCDFNGSHDGRAFYAVLWMLTGEKFFGTFGWGDRYLLSELNDRLVNASSGDARRLHAQQLVGNVGGIQRVALELLATSMASWRDRRMPIPEGFEQNWSYWDDPVRLARRARLFLPRDSERWIAEADEAVDALAALLGRGTADSGLTGLVARSLDHLPGTSMFPVIETQRRPAAAVLAVSLHLAPRSESDDLVELERFLARLPPPLVAGAARLAAGILHIETAVAQADPKAVLLEHLKFLHFDQQIATD